MKLLATLFRNPSADERLRLEESATEVHASAAFLEALTMSHGDLAKILRDALKAEYPGERTYVWTRDVYDAAVVYELCADDQTELYQRSYTITDGAVTLGDAIKVISVTQYVPADTATIAVPATPITQVSQPAAESSETELTGDLVPLVEKAVKKDGTATIRIIAPGQGSSGFYPAEVLKRDGPKAFGEGTHIYLDHPSVSDESNRPERSVRDLAGSLTGPAEWKEDGLYAPVKFIDSVAPHINAIAPISGMSIRASGKTGTREIDGKKTRTIESIDFAHSVDVVTRAGAGGKVMDLIESARKGQGGNPPERTDDVSQEELDELRKELKESKDREAARDQELARLREANVIRDAHAFVIESLAKIALPDVTRQRLAGQLAANPPVKDGVLDREALETQVKEAADAETAYLASVNGGNPVRNMGGTAPTTPDVPTLEESDKRINAALAAL